MMRKSEIHDIEVSSHDNNIIKEYKQAKKLFHSTLRNTVTSYFGNQLEINRNDISKTWYGMVIVYLTQHISIHI